jgi:predicted enzyme related to lactoylglutathione lyase
VLTPRVEVMVDCLDPVALAAFWAAALGTQVAGGDGDPYVELVPTPGQPVICFQRVPEAKVGKARIHLDLYVPEDQATAEVQRLVALGATVAGDPVRTRAGRFNFQILTDPEGTELCLCAEHP